jgi:hypothetical protein
MAGFDIIVLAIATFGWLVALVVLVRTVRDFARDLRTPAPARRVAAMHPPGMQPPRGT